MPIYYVGAAVGSNSTAAATIMGHSEMGEK